MVRIITNPIYGLKYTNLRFGSLYGIKANNSNFIYRMISDANTKGRMVRNGDGSEIRNYINVKDVAKYCIVALQKKYENKNIMMLGQERKSIKQVLNLIKSKLNKKIKIDYNGERDFAHYKTSPFTFKKRKVEYLRGVKEISFEDGIKEIIEEISFQNAKKIKINEKTKLLIFTSKNEFISELIKIFNEQFVRYEITNFLLPGGKTPIDFYKELSKQKFDWGKLTFSLTDERLLNKAYHKSSQLNYTNINLSLIHI